MLLLFALLTVAFTQTTYYDLTANQNFRRSGAVLGSTEYFAYTASINEVADNTPGTLRYTVSYDATLRNVRLELYFCDALLIPVAQVVPGYDCPASPCVLHVAPCTINGGDQYIFNSRYFLRVINTTTAYNVTVVDAAAAFTSAAVDGRTYSAILATTAQGAQPPTAYKIFRYSHSDLNQVLATWVENRNTTSAVQGYSFSNSAENVCLNQATLPTGSITSRFQSYLESQASCPALEGSTRFLFTSTAQNAINPHIGASFFANTNDSILLTPGANAVPISFQSNFARPTAFVRFVHPASSYMRVDINNSGLTATCRVWYRAENTFGYPTANWGTGCTTQSSPVRRQSINPGSVRSLFFSSCEAGVTWYLTIACPVAEGQQDILGNHLYVSVTSAQTEAQVFGAANTTSYGTNNIVINDSTRTPFKITNTTELPEGTPQRIVNVVFRAGLTEVSNYQVQISRGSPQDDAYTNCQTGGSNGDITLLASILSEPRWISWLPCQSVSTTGSLFLTFNADTYNTTVTTRGWGTLPVNTTRTGTLAGRQIAAFVPSFPSDETQFTYIELSGTGTSLYPWDNTLCAEAGINSIRTNGYFHFCPGSAYSITPSTTFMAVQGLDQTAASQSYSLISTSYPLGSRYRYNWNPTNDINVTFDGFSNRLRRRTVEWDNRNEGWQVTIRQNTDANTRTTVAVFDDCTFKASLICDLNGVGATCTFGSANGGFPGSYTGDKIRVLLSDNANFDYSANFHYEAGGNCRAVTNLANRFCSASIDTTKLYNFLSDAEIDDRDQNARDLFQGSLNLYNTSAATAACIADLKAFACQTYYLPCDSVNSNVDKTPCGTACEAIADSCGANRCFDETCAALECPSSASQILGMLPLLSLFFFWLSL